jgi:O-antigen/teichoic acid export membrane protein
MLKLAVKNSFYGMLGQLVVAVLGLVFAGMTIKYLGVERAGFFILISSMLGVVQMAGGGVFHAPAVQKIAKLSSQKKNNFHEIIRTVISANILVGLPFVLAVIFIFPTLFSWSQLDEIYRYNSQIVVLFVAVAFILNQYSSGLTAVYEGLQRFNIVAILKIIFGVFGNLAKLITLIYFSDMISLAFVIFSVSFVRLLIDILLVYKLTGVGVFPGWSWDALKPLLKFGFWNWLTNTGNVIFINVTGIILTKNLGSAALAYVSLPQTIILQLGGLIISSVYFIFPAFAGEGKLINEKIKSIEDRVRWFISLITFTVYTGLFLAGTQLLTHLVDSSYAELALMPLLLFCIYGIIWAQEIFYVFTIMSTGKNLHIGAIVHITTTAAILVASVLLIPRVGYIGVPLAFLFKLIGVVWLAIWSRRILNLDTSIKSNIIPFISSFIGSIVWIIFMYSFRFFYSESLFKEVTFWFIGLVLFLITVLSIEIVFFSNKKRISTLTLAISLIIAPVSQKLSNKLKSVTL